MKAQEILVHNKSQLMAAFECARECPFPTIITLAKSRTTYYIEPNDVTKDEPDPDNVPAPDIAPQYFWQESAWVKYAKRRKAAGRFVSTIKGRLRKTDASAIY